MSLTPAAKEPLSKDAIKKFAALLSEGMYRPGPTIGDRPAWAAIAALPDVQSICAKAEADLKEASPALPKELFEAFNVTGDRRAYEILFRKRSDRLAHFALAECVEASGRFLPEIEAELALILAEDTWAVPAHWYARGGHKGTMVVDLAATARSALLSVVDSWLGARLKAETRAAIRREVARRVLGPYLEAARSGRIGSGVSWMTAVNNWNAVCHAGVLVSALTLVESREYRAEFLAGAEAYLPIYLRDGFTAEGYCTEGTAYWNYGFGAYVELAHAVHAATAGRVDWLQGERIRAIAEYPARLAITPGVFPSFSDNSPGTPFSAWALDVLERRLALGQPGWRVQTPSNLPLYHPLGATLHRVAVALRAGGLNEGAGGGAVATPAVGLRDEFAEAQVFILRPAEAQPAFGLAFKGGHNDELHNHNDLGSFVIALDGATPILDPGMEIYTKRSFGPQRYESRVNSSFGHGVPLVAGREQSPGRRFAAQVLSRSYTDMRDEVHLDIKGGYEVPELQSLERTFVFERGAQPVVKVVDQVGFATPQTFGTALVTLGQFEVVDGRTVRVSDGGRTVEVTIDSGGKAFQLHEEVLHENLPSGRIPRRLGITLKAPVSEARVTLRIVPVKP